MSSERGFTVIGQFGAVFAEGESADAEGRLCAMASTTCLLLDLPPG